MITTQKATKLFKDDQITYLITYSMNLEKLRSKKHIELILLLT